MVRLLSEVHSAIGRSRIRIWIYVVNSEAKRPPRPGGPKRSSLEISGVVPFGRSSGEDADDAGDGVVVGHDREAAVGEEPDEADGPEAQEDEDGRRRDAV